MQIENVGNYDLDENLLLWDEYHKNTSALFRRPYDETTYLKSKK